MSSIETLEEKTERLRLDLDKVEAQVKVCEDRVTKLQLESSKLQSEFKPLKNFFYVVVTTVLLGIITAIINLIIHTK